MGGRRGRAGIGALRLPTRGPAAGSPAANSHAAVRSAAAGRSGRPPGFDRELYAKRNVAERCVNRFKQWRGIATRYEKRAANYRAMVVIAALMIWLSS